MTTITKSIEITASRHLHLDMDLPEHLPVGPAELRLTISPAARIAPDQTRKPFEGLFGALKNKNIYDAGGLELQRAWRDEWPA